MIPPKMRDALKAAMAARHGGEWPEIIDQTYAQSIGHGASGFSGETLWRALLILAEEGHQAKEVQS